ncbi:MAG: hypothetical protein JWO24_1851 [Rhodospirillales bacterium]|jgi:hypothetical protein|nr:hypothetical protein [Rhodospirillales bacterium]
MRHVWEARGGSAHRERTKAAAREIVLARYPALPLTMIEAAVALVARR